MTWRFRICKTDAVQSTVMRMRMKGLLGFPERTGGGEGFAGTTLVPFLSLVCL